MRISRGVDVRLPAIILAVAVMVSGCLAQPVAKPAKPITERTLEDVAYEAFQSRDRVRAAKLRALKGTRFDLKRQEAVTRAGAEAAAETWAPVAKALAAILDKAPQGDQAAFDAAMESLAKASERASK